MGNITVGHSDGVFHHVAQKPQAGTQHQGYLWDEAAQTGTDGIRAGLILLKGVVHHKTSRKDFHKDKIVYTIFPENAMNSQ